MNTSLDLQQCDRVENLTTRIPRALFLSRKLTWTDHDKALYTIVLPIISVIGIIANLAFLFTIIRVKRMQTTTNYYLANLAAADILFLVVQIASRLHAFTHSPYRENTPYDSQHNCWIKLFPIMLGYYASVELVTLVSMERYYAICKPHYHRHMRSKRYTIRWIIGAWIFAFALSAITVPRYGKMRRLCFLWPDREEFHHLSINFNFCKIVTVGLGITAEIVRFLTFLIAFFVSCFAYYKLIRALNNLDFAATSSNRKKGNRTVRNQVARLLIINGAVFFITQFSARCISLDAMIKEANPGAKNQRFILLAVGFILLLINSAINPFIYGLSSRLYRVAFCHAFGIAKFFDMEKLSSHNDSFRGDSSFRSSLSKRGSNRKQEGSASTLDALDNAVLPMHEVNISLSTLDALDDTAFAINGDKTGSVSAIDDQVPTNDAAMTMNSIANENGDVLNKDTLGDAAILPINTITEKTDENMCSCDTKVTHGSPHGSSKYF